MIKRNPIVKMGRAVKLFRLNRLKKSPKRLKLLAEIHSLGNKVKIRKHAEQVHNLLATKPQFAKTPLSLDSAERREKIRKEISQYQKQIEEKKLILKKQRKSFF